MTRGAILYYSATGNTALACRHLVNRLPASLDLVDIVRSPEVDVAAFDIVGFATSTDFWGVPQRFESFIASLPRQNARPAFVLNTYGGVSGKTLPLLAAGVTARGFDVVAGYSFHMPDSYPPLMARGFGAPNAPGAKELAAFDAFASQIADVLSAVHSGARPMTAKLPLKLVDRVFPKRARTTARDSMGPKRVDAAVCTECGLCERDCPYGAIRLDPKPVFDMSRCYGCWRCYNRCPVHAISAGTFRAPFYAGPSDALKAKLDGDTGAQSAR